jgi:hypothetical protein
MMLGPSWGHIQWEPQFQPGQRPFSPLITVGTKLRTVSWRLSMIWGVLGLPATVALPAGGRRGHPKTPAGTLGGTGDTAQGGGGQSHS